MKELILIRLDTVWRPALLCKILRKGIGGNFFNTIKYMFSTTKGAVRQGNLCSDFLNTTWVVKQGDNLSPTLSNILVDDFESYFDNVISYPVSLGDITFNHLFFADDLVLISESAEGLQNCMDTLSNYCMEWKLQLHGNLPKK